MLYNDDCIKVMNNLPDNKIDLIFADPPYFLSNGGLSIHSGKIVSVNKGEWDKQENYKDVQNFTNSWLLQCFRILKPGGSIWVSGTHHNIFDVERCMKKIGFKIVNIVIWHKSDPPPLIYKNKFKFSYETIIWASKGKPKYFNYEEMVRQANGDEMHDVWTLPAVKMSEKKFGYHPTQKPECLLERIIVSTSKPGDIVLDPFMGSGTTCAVARRLGRRVVGIEKELDYFNIAKKRILNEQYIKKQNEKYIVNDEDAHILMKKTFE